jgi:hypothetical protein
MRKLAVMKTLVMPMRAWSWHNGHLVHVVLAQGTAGHPHERAHASYLNDKALASNFWASKVLRFSPSIELVRVTRIIGLRS